MSEDEDRRDEDEKVHGNGHAQLRTQNRFPVQTNRPLHVGCPQGVERPAETKVNTDHGERLDDEDHNDGVAEPLFERHDADADILKQDRELERHVGEDIKDNARDGQLALLNKLGGTDGLDVSAESVDDRFNGQKAPTRQKWINSHMPMITDMATEKTMAQTIQ